VIRLEATRPISASVKFLLIFNLPFLNAARTTVFRSDRNREICVSDDNAELVIVQLCFMLWK
jgi:hypothetical protein